MDYLQKNQYEVSQLPLQAFVSLRSENRNHQRETSFLHSTCGMSAGDILSV